MNVKILKNIINTLLCFVIVYEVVFIIQAGIECGISDTANISIKILSDFGKGINPYSTSWLVEEGALPMTYWESGFFHILPALLFVKICGFTPSVSSAIVHIVYVLLAMIMMFIIVKKMTNNISLSFFASGILFFCINPTYVTCIRPDTLCVLLCLSIIFLCVNENIKVSISEWILSILIVTLIFLKIHYASILVAVYIIWFIKRRWIQLSVKCFLVGSITTIIVGIIFPTFYSTFVVRIIEMMRSNNSNSDYEYMLYQWKELFVRFVPLFIVLLVGFIFGITRIKKKNTNKGLTLLITNLVFNIIALCYMGKWSGNFLAYHNVMIMPTVIILSMITINQLIENNNIGRYVICLAIMVVSFLLLIKYDDYSIPRLDYELLKQHRLGYNGIVENYSDGEMLLSPSCAQYAYENDYYLWDWGDQIYLPYDIGTSPRWNTLFPYTNVYRNKNIEYANNILIKIIDRDYSLIVTDDYNEFGHKIGMREQFWDAIKENYDLINKDDLVGYWVPKER